MASDETISCPHCGRAIRLSDALLHPMQERLKAHLLEELAEQRRTQLHELDLERKELQAKAEEVRTQMENLHARVEAEVREKLPLARAEAKRQLEEEQRTEVEARVAELRMVRDRLAQTQGQEIQLRERMQVLEQEKRELDLQVARQVAEQGAKLHAEHALELREKDEHLEGLRREIAQLKQRAEQGSQQLQGEVQELELESVLQETFPQDAFEPVPKGREGADVIQVVRSGPGHQFGRILWESKRTKEWSREWISKVKKDQADTASEMAVIVSQALPEEVPTFGDQGGIVVTSFRYVVPLAALLRSRVVDLSKARQANVGRSEKKEMLYSYITGTEFLNAFRNAVESSAEVIGELQAERTALLKRWKKRQKLIERNIAAIAEVYGSIQSLVGSLPEIPALNLEPPEGGVQLSLPEAEEEEGDGDDPSGSSGSS